MFFIWCGAVRIHPRWSPHLHPQRIRYGRVYIFVLFGCRLDLFDFTESIRCFSLRGVCWGRRCAHKWVEFRQKSWCPFWPNVVHPRSWHRLTPRHPLIFSESIDQILQAQSSTITNFFYRRCLYILYQKSSYINNCLPDCAFCWHERNFGWLWENFNRVCWPLFPNIWDLYIVHKTAIHDR